MFYMYTLQLPFDESFELVQKARSFIEPNAGFVRQLKLYEQMGFKVDKDDPVYKQFRKEHMM